MNCRETAGLLFKHDCGAPAVATCSHCGRPVCSIHQRPQAAGPICVTCLRDAMKNPSYRANLAHLRDDPYFFWYYGGDNWFKDPYGADDYALFDADDADFEGQGPTRWEGS